MSTLNSSTQEEGNLKMTMWNTVSNLLSFEGVFKYDTRTFSLPLTMCKISFFMFGICGIFCCEYFVTWSGEKSVECASSTEFKNLSKSFIEAYCLTNGTFTFPK